jgi:hypothetical protein
LRFNDDRGPRAHHWMGSSARRAREQQDRGATPPSVHSFSVAPSGPCAA